ncbi:MAG TPA: DUF1801 domain-containing protein [bacterium]|nr:DUF1801 domain-containing protein [bacterium]HPN43811.1 DUF1801 domain-containing protein [bacterium]
MNKTGDKTKPQTIDDYISLFPTQVREILQNLRQIIRQNAPEAVETMSYQIPTFNLNGNLVHFAAFKTHIGFYPAPSGIAAFREELADYKFAKGSVQFPIDEPLPLELIGRIVRFRVEENVQKKKKQK